MMFAQVFVNVPTKQIAEPFLYSIPEDLAFLGVGWRVLVPFGKRKAEGFIVGTKAEIDDKGFEIKDIIAPIDEEPWFFPQTIELSRELASFYLCSLSEIMRLFMPGKSGVKISQVLFANQEAHPPENEVERAIYNYLSEKGKTKRSEVKKKFSQSVGAKQSHHAPAPALAHPCPSAGAKQSHHAPAPALAHPCPSAENFDNIVEKLLRGKIILRDYEAKRRVQKRLEALNPSEEEKKALPERKLTESQENALKKILAPEAEDRYQGFLLYGVTGSGKTQVYIEAALAMRGKGKKVMMIVPEIALTGQVVDEFRDYFGKDVAVFHSRLTIKERTDSVLRVRRGEAGVIIGARSALFVPVENVGLIILDEEQDASYKQDESPRYHAKEVAQRIARIYNAKLVLGSATPSMESAYKVKTKELTLLSMPNRIGSFPLPKVKIVDMRQELFMGNRKIISRELKALIKNTLLEGKQCIIMLNRRGFSTFVMCRSCGNVVTCPECGLPMVYHKTKHGNYLLCHHCDVKKETPDTCPHCQSPYIKYFGSGTEKLEAELKELVPEAKIIRMDRDTTTKKFAHQEIMRAFRQGKYDILLGTQMVSKGHDVASVRAVGIISADSGLYSQDFRAPERTFMLLTQTAGRAGRRGSEGEVIVQTYSPDHYAVKAGAAQDYRAFYEKEIKLRQELFYPPFSRLIKLLFTGKEEALAQNLAKDFARRFKNSFPNENTVIIGPAPAAIANFKGVFRFALLIKTKELSSVQSFLRDENLHKDPAVIIDIDPITTF